MTSSTNPIAPPAPADATKDSEEDSSSATSNAVLEASKPPDKVEIAEEGVGAAAVTTDKDTAMATAVVAATATATAADDPMEEDPVGPATVFCIRLKQPRSNLLHKMSVPELCRNFR